VWCAPSRMMTVLTPANLRHDPEIWVTPPRAMMRGETSDIQGFFLGCYANREGFSPWSGFARAMHHARGCDPDAIGLF
jgi:hypothetical protein